MRRLLATLLTALTLTQPVQAAEMGDDGLHKPDWLRVTFKDMSDDLAEARAEGKRLVVIFEQRGCVYCHQMHEEIFPDPGVDALLRENYFIVQMNLYGDEEVTDFDGTVLPEKEMAARWGVVFTPTMLFLPDEDPGDVPASEAAVATMPGAFGVGTTTDMLNWVLLKGYQGEESFQRYHARMIQERDDGNFD